MNSFDRFYAKYSPSFPFRLAARAVFTRSKIGKISLLNRQRDYVDLAHKPQWLPLHRGLNDCVTRAATEWQSYDYGEGYFYQSLSQIGIRGLRDTEGRVEEMRLCERIEGRRVLEIGCNSGFLSVTIAKVASEIVAFDLNPHLIEMAEATSRHVGIENATFRVSSFAAFTSTEPFDAVLSFANHSTFDGNTDQTLPDYFDRCREFLEPGGLFLFESHPPEHEGDGLERVCDLIADRFAIEDRAVLNYGSFLDRGRTFIVGRRP